ncbi:hypothetical protein AGABI1DRAFT_135437 [Agaricus bisporus var. burnettii JB137-S8]|uniref:Uncharacterized protein n=1 Tax=Agaricus bisporus var. burnettii (strain JB137-S8 / ATCC MYA-4627 / FGSC 10392) TaxID=597362 RepID=K5WRN3_AGABU|nr:uncharacterized protein AGABI1DRAFT_135437 [Agaricus bisporus var. burnettii JB137-S8]EKM73177.1 hypothetical protein AGABI1DRAFT_135437 [Agaricus bisporus var. burnettii JB137-S8]
MIDDPRYCGTTSPQRWTVPGYCASSHPGSILSILILSMIDDPQYCGTTSPQRWTVPEYCASSHWGSILVL